MIYAKTCSITGVFQGVYLRFAEILQEVMERRDVAIMACAVEILVSVRVPVSLYVIGSLIMTGSWPNFSKTLCLSISMPRTKII